MLSAVIELAVTSVSTQFLSLRTVEYSSFWACACADQLIQTRAVATGIVKMFVAHVVSVCPLQREMSFGQ